MTDFIDSPAPDAAEFFVPEPTEVLVETTPELGELFGALALAQGEMKDPPKNKTAKVPMKAGGTYSYKYSDLADLFQITRPVLARHGLCLLQMPVNPRQGSVKVVTRLGHKSGQWIQWVLTMPVGDDKPQTMGSSITYGKRYAGSGAACVAPDEDDDGQVAQDAAPDRVADRPPQTLAPAAVYDPALPAMKKAAAAVLQRAGVAKQDAMKACSDWLVAEKVKVGELDNAITHWAIATSKGTKPYQGGAS